MSVTSTNSALSFSNITIGNDGKTLRVKVTVGDTSPGSAIINLSNTNGSDSTTIGIAPKAAGSPQASNATVGQISQNNTATLVVNGQNLSGATAEVMGIQAKVTNVTTTDTSLNATLEFSPFYTQKDKVNFLAYLVNQANALVTNNGVVVVTNTNGSTTVPVSAPQPSSFQTGTGPSSTTFSFGFTNPLKGGVKNVADLFNLIGAFIYDLGIPVAVIIIIYGGVLMVTSAGNPTKYKKGIYALRYAIIGLAIILIGKGFVSLVQSLLSVGK